MGIQASGTGAPGWSPDGRQIVYASDAEGQFEIYAISVTGGKPRRLTFDPAFDHGPRFSRDGKWIYFNSQRSGEYDIWRMPAGGGNAIQVTQEAGFAVNESPDGAYLYFVGTAVAGSPLWRQPVSGGQPEKVLDGVIWWSAEVLDRGIYYLDRPAAEARLQFFHLATRTSTTVARGLGEWTASLTVAPDGRTVLFSRVDSSINDLMLVEDFR
jgi:tricorn protease-like protein